MNFEQTIYDMLGRMLGLEQMQSVADFKFSFAASWAQRRPLLMLFGFVGLVAAAALFYFRHQPNRHRRWRFVLFVIRALVFCQVLSCWPSRSSRSRSIARNVPPCGCFDGTDSMNIADDLPPDVRKATEEAVGIEREPGEGQPGSQAPGRRARRRRRQRPSRIEYLRALVRRKTRTCWNNLPSSSACSLPVRVDAGCPLARTGRGGHSRSTASTWPSNSRPTARSPTWAGPSPIWPTAIRPAAWPD